jgi:cytochrome P450
VIQLRRLFAHEPAPDKVKARPRCAYMPFGAGPRICLGMSFAMLEMATILATLVRDFHFATVPGHKLELDPSFAVRPRGPFPIFAEPLRALAGHGLAQAAA